MDQGRRGSHHSCLPWAAGLRSDAAGGAAEPQQPEQLPFWPTNGSGAHPHVEHQAPEPEQRGAWAGRSAIKPAATKAAARGEGKGAGAGAGAYGGDRGGEGTKREESVGAEGEGSGQRRLQSEGFWIFDTAIQHYTKAMELDDEDISYMATLPIVLLFILTWESMMNALRTVIRLLREEGNYMLISRWSRGHSPEKELLLPNLLNHRKTMMLPLRLSRRR